MSAGSIYGAGIYSSGEYSWFQVWMLIACKPVEHRRKGSRFYVD